MSRFRRSYIASIVAIIICLLAAILRAVVFHGIPDFGGAIPILILLAIAFIPVIPEGGIASHPKSATGVAFVFVFAFGSGLLVGLSEVGLIGQPKNQFGWDLVVMTILPLLALLLLWLATALCGLWAIMKVPKPNKPAHTTAGNAPV